MSSHITINGRTYASVEQMPPDVRRQYESILQTLAGQSGPNADVNISTATSHRLIVNGRECHSVADVPAEIRASLGDAAIAEALGAEDAAGGAAAPRPIAETSYPINPSRIWGRGAVYNPSFDSSWRMTMGLNGVIFLLIIVFLIGAFLGFLAGIFLGTKLH